MTPPHRALPSGSATQEKDGRKPADKPESTRSHAAPGCPQNTRAVRRRTSQPNRCPSGSTTLKHPSLPSHSSFSEDSVAAFSVGSEASLSRRKSLLTGFLLLRSSTLVTCAEIFRGPHSCLPNAR